MGGVAIVNYFLKDQMQNIFKNLNSSRLKKLITFFMVLALFTVVFDSNQICFGNMRMINWGVVDTTLSENDITFNNNSNLHPYSNQLLLNHKISVYPNPANDRIAFSLNIIGNTFTDELEIFNVLGVKVGKVEITKNNDSVWLDVSNYAKGFYTAKLKHHTDVITKFNIIH
jgi:hypothetical protein